MRRSPAGLISSGFSPRAGFLPIRAHHQAAPKGAVAQVKIAEQTIPANTPNFASVLGQAITAHGYPAAADTSKINYPMTILLLSILVIFVTLVYAPIAAWLVELFPTRIRYSGLSLPYHIGNGWFGGFLPAIVLAIVAATGNIYSGLWYPIVITPWVSSSASSSCRRRRTSTSQSIERGRGGRILPASPTCSRGREQGLRISGPTLPGLLHVAYRRAGRTRHWAIFRKNFAKQARRALKKSVERRQGAAPSAAKRAINGTKFLPILG
jgi:hypothetical protein